MKFQIILCVLARPRNVFSLFLNCIFMHLNFSKYYSSVVSDQITVSGRIEKCQDRISRYQKCQDMMSAHKKVTVLNLSSKYISSQSQLVTETVASGGDRFGKLFELMDQVCHSQSFIEHCFLQLTVHFNQSLWDKFDTWKAF